MLKKKYQCLHDNFHTGAETMNNFFSLMTSLLSCSNTDGSFRLLKMKEEDQNTFMRTLKT